MQLSNTTFVNNMGSWDSTMIEYATTRLVIKRSPAQVLEEMVGEFFLPQGQLSVLTLISVSNPPPYHCSSTQKILVILPKVQVAGYT